MQSRERRGSTIRSRYRQSARPDWSRHTDYIVDLRDAACRDREAVYCGTGGCDLYILVTYPSGGTRLVFGQHVREYEVLPGNGARTIRFALHGGYCGGHGNPSCVKTHRITGQPFKFVMPQ
jgi:hypothetical protein